MRWCDFLGSLRYGWLALLVGACGNGDQHGEESSGVPGLIVDREPVVVIGDVEGPMEHLLHDIVQVHLTEQGEVVVVDQGLQTIRLYDLRGEFVGRIGRRGEGPGEYQRIVGTWLTEPDTLRVQDISGPSLTTYLLDGTFLEVVNLQGFIGHPDILVGGFRDGSFLLGQANYGAAEDPIVADVMWFDEYSHSGEYVRRMAVEEGIHRYVDPSRGGSGFVSHPFSGFAQAVLYRDSLLYTNGRSSVNVWARDASLVRSIPLPEPGMTLGEAWTEFRKARAARQSDGGPPDVPEVDAIPQVAGMVIDDRGRLWVKRFEPGRDSFWLGPSRGGTGGTWWVVNLAGELQATVALPSGLALHQVRGKHLVGVTTDELNVQRVVVHRIVGGSELR